MNNVGMLCLSLVLGISLGVIFFLGLRWTVALSASIKYPVLLFCLSFLMRGAAVLSGFYWLANGHFERFALLLLGFMISRKLCVRQRRADEHNA